MKALTANITWLVGKVDKLFETHTFFFFFFFFSFFFLSFLPIPSSSLSEEDRELSNEYSSWKQSKIGPCTFYSNECSVFFKYLSCHISPFHVLLLRGVRVDSCLPLPCPGLQAPLPVWGTANHQEGPPLAAGHLQHLLHQELHSTGGQDYRSLADRPCKLSWWAVSVYNHYEGSAVVTTSYYHADCIKPNERIMWLHFLFVPLP